MTPNRFAMKQHSSQNKRKRPTTESDSATWASHFAAAVVVFRSLQNKQLSLVFVVVVVDLVFTLRWMP